MNYDSPKIDKAVPTPTERFTAAKLRANYPFAEMAVGDSFFLDAEHEGMSIYAGSKTPRIAMIASRFGKKNAKKFSTRSIDGGVRIWRIA